MLYEDTKTEIKGSGWVWSECDCTPSSQSHEAILYAKDLEGKKSKILVKFTETRNGLPKFNKVVDLQLNVFTDIKVLFAKNSSPKYNFDENVLPYPEISKKHGPALYINYLSNDELAGTAKPKMAFKSISLKSFDENGLNEKTNVNFRPNMFNSETETIKFNLANDPLHHKEICQIHSCQKDLVLYTRGKRVASINVFNLCESDDDEQINLGEVASAMDVCVSPGPDGSLDEYAALKLGYGTRWVDSDDEVVEINGVKHVVAGPKLKNGKPFCNTKARKKNITCPNVIDFTSVMDEVSKFYLDNANIDVTFNIMPNLNINFDSRIDDDKMDGSTGGLNDESRDFRSSRYGDPEGKPYSPEAFIVKGIIGMSLETAAFAGRNCLWAQDIKSTNTSLIWSHEIGHQLWDLRHPENLGVSGDSVCWMKANIEPSNLLSKHGMNLYYLLVGIH